MVYHAEYRLAHWAGFRTVRDSHGEPLEFRNPMDAALKAAGELVNALNGTEAWWRGKSGDEAREAAERLFQNTRADNGGKDSGGETQGEARAAED